MKINQIRAAALAILKGAKLVYAKGYTWAEADYPIVFPTTLFRQASVSKIFTAVAIYQLIPPLLVVYLDLPYPPMLGALTVSY
jgi:CubicO group peptidase (beta-lactamase class C family)